MNMVAALRRFIRPCFFSKKISKKKIEKKIEKIFRGKLSKLIVSYYVLIKRAFFGTFLRNRQTDGRKDCLTELHVAAKK